jgi:asparagine synthase (glutamine-hydrolysing)
MGDPEMLRTLLVKVLDSIPACDAVLLSGGLDTSALVAMSLSPTSGHHKLKHAITIGTADARDLIHAFQIAVKRGLEHHVVPLDAAALFDPAPGSVLEFTIRTLKRFDPMEIRNALCIAACLRKAKELGIGRVMTGDGADELFAGYSFLRSIPKDKLRAYMDRTFATMKFSAVALGEEIGVEVLQPFLDSRVKKFAASVEPEDLIGLDPSGVETGKLVLRYAVPECESVWRAKEPVEGGSGMTGACADYFANAVPALDLVEVAQIKAEDGVVIRDTEHLHLFRVFKRTFSTSGTISIPNWQRYGSDPCRECGWQLEAATQDFCVICGAYPARA